MYFLNVLQARQNPGMQGFWLALQMPFAAGVITAPWMLFDTWYHRGLHELGIFLGYAAVWYYMNYKRSESLRMDVLNWDFTIKNHGLQAAINEIQSF